MLRAKSLRLVPLGGLAEIGMNCLAIEQHDGILVVDCGTAFPQDDLGIDVVHPDFTWLIERASRVSGVVLTETKTTTAFAHTSLDACRIALEALARGDRVARKLPRGYGPLRDQLSLVLGRFLWHILPLCGFLTSHEADAT
jgi:hypothetical protein